MKKFTNYNYSNPLLKSKAVGVHQCLRKTKKHRRLIKYRPVKITRERVKPDTSNFRKRFKKRRKTVRNNSPDPNQIFDRKARNLLKFLVSTTTANPQLLLRLQRYMDFIDHVRKHKSISYAAKVSKEIRRCFLNYLGESKFLPSPKIKIRITPSGYPTVLGTSLLYLDNPENVRIVLTCLSVTRRIVLANGIADTSSITTKSTVNTNFCEFDESLKRFAYFLKDEDKLKKSSNPKKRRKLFEKRGLVAKIKDWQDFHLTTKSGPTGNHALMSC